MKLLVSIWKFTCDADMPECWRKTLYLQTKILRFLQTSYRCEKTPQALFMGRIHWVTSCLSGWKTFTFSWHLTWQPPLSLGSGSCLGSLEIFSRDQWRALLLSFVFPWYLGFSTQKKCVKLRDVLENSNHSLTNLKKKTNGDFPDNGELAHF